MPVHWYIERVITNTSPLLNFTSALLNFISPLLNFTSALLNFISGLLPVVLTLLVHHIIICFRAPVCKLGEKNVFLTLCKFWWIFFDFQIFSSYRK